MKFIAIFKLTASAFLSLMMMTACGKETPSDTTPPTPAKITGLQLSSESLWLAVGGTQTLRVLAFVCSDGSKQPVGSAQINWTTDNNKVASVSSEGLITGIAEGETRITASAQGVSASATVTVRSDASSTGIDAPLAASHVYSMGHYLKSNTVIQGFDITRDGTIYYMQIAGSNAHQLLVLRAKPNKSGYTDTYDGVMTFQYFGHGTNYAVEEAADGLYVWVGCYASMGTTPGTSRYRQYWDNQTVARVKYEPGKTVTPKECAAQFYMGPYKEIHPAVDVENDVLAINFPTTHPTEPRRFRMYRLSEAMALPLSTVTLQELTWGGGTSTDPQTTESPKVLVRDLRKLTPLGEFGIANSGLAPTPDDLSHYAWQGFEVNDGLIYYFEGEGRNDGVESAAYLTVFDFGGHLAERRTKTAAASDMAALTSLGITASGYMEAEGVKVRNGKLYLGFASRDKVNDASKFRANIFTYSKVH